ncbi:hypothetical protein D5S18_12250 [Nocardia panacis]|uniref:Uncharacterized protein n=1 Tax=Nocardia panacis TaxID=2340916 RepID=A0A3A4KAQ5_9NOCA|nr:hypothetical protein [Nocardia panacis]RJO76970.1 hypothetical protein D5S18_12250 [Nocardia panacis]
MSLPTGDEYGRGRDRWAEDDWVTRFLVDWTPEWGVLVYHRDDAGRSYPSAVYGPYSEDEARTLVEQPNFYIKPPGDQYQTGRRLIPWRPGKPKPYRPGLMTDDSDKDLRLLTIGRARLGHHALVRAVVSNHDRPELPGANPASGVRRSHLPQEVVGAHRFIGSVDSLSKYLRLHRIRREVPGIRLHHDKM